MIFTFQGRDREKYSGYADQMFRLRAEVFFNRLKWDVRVTDGRELDEFDDLDPLYVLSVIEGQVVGCARLLPTMGPTLLQSHLASIFADRVDISHPLILECTRLAVADGMPEGLTPGGVCRTTANLMISGCELFIKSGIFQILGAFDRSMLGVYRRIGWTPDIVTWSHDRRIGVGLWDVSDEILEKMRSRHGVSDQIFGRAHVAAMPSAKADVISRVWDLIRRAPPAEVDGAICEDQ